MQTLTPEEYFYKLHKSTEELSFTQQHCPNCDNINCWDLDSNIYKGTEDMVVFICQCGAKWTEHWKLTKVILEETNG